MITHTQSGTGIQDKRVDYTYDVASQRDIIHRYSDLAATQLIASTDYTYDNNGRLTDLTHLNNDGTITAFDYTYDEDNRLTEFASDEGVSIYNYDDTNQLTAAEHNYQIDEAYTYDDNGNRVGAGYSTGINNQLLSDGVYNYEYDGEGNLIKQTNIATNEVLSYEWDYRNRLIGVVITDDSDNVIANYDYTYDIHNSRIAKSIDADGNGIAEEIEKYILDGEEIALVFDENNNEIERFFHGVGIDEVIAVELEPDTVYWSLADQLGSVRILLDNAGETVNQISYDAFGNITNQSDPTIDPRFTYTGRELDKETGNYYYRSRYYNPATGRFLNEDLIGFEGGDTNLYRYVNNSPTMYIDPSGSMMERLGRAYNNVKEALAIGANQSDDFYIDLAANGNQLQKEIGAIGYGFLSLVPGSDAQQLVMERLGRDYNNVKEALAIGANQSDDFYIDLVANGNLLQQYIGKRGYGFLSLVPGSDAQQQGLGAATQLILEGEREGDFWKEAAGTTSGLVYSAFSEENFDKTSTVLGAGVAVTNLPTAFSNGATIGAGFSLIRQGAQILDGEQSEFSLTRLGIDTAIGSTFGSLTLGPRIAFSLVGIGGLLGIASSARQLSQKNYYTAAVDFITAGLSLKAASRFIQTKTTPWHSQDPKLSRAKISLERAKNPDSGHIKLWKKRVIQNGKVIEKVTKIENIIENIGVSVMTSEQIARQFGKRKLLEQKQRERDKEYTIEAQEKEAQEKARKKAQEEAIIVKASKNKLTNYNTYTSNYIKAFEEIPDNHQIHHLIPNEIAQTNGLVQQALNKRLWKIDDAKNLKALPSNRSSYDKSLVKIKHSGSHPIWSKYVDSVLDEAKVNLLQNPNYKTLKDVPDSILKQTLKDVENDLRKDIHNTDLGLKEEWIKIDKDGMQKLSKNQSIRPIG